MGEVVHVVAISSETSSVLDSMKSIGYPIHKAYIVYRKKDSLNAVESVNRALSSLVDSKILDFEGKKIYQIVWELLGVVRHEIEKGNSVLFNVTDADRLLCMAFVIAAQISNSKIYLSSENGARFLQTPPLKKFNGDRIKILKVLVNEGGSVDSINRLIELVDGRIEEQKKYMAQRARMSYHLNELEEDGLLVTERKGKHLKIEVTDLGKAYAVMFG